MWINILVVYFVLINKIYSDFFYLIFEVNFELVRSSVEF